MRPGPKPQDDTNRIPSKKLDYAREYRRRYNASKSRCKCSRPKVGMLDGSPICAYCLEIETRKIKKHVHPNPKAIESADAYSCHLPRSTSAPSI